MIRGDLAYHNDQLETPVDGASILWCLYLFTKEVMDGKYDRFNISLQGANLVMPNNEERQQLHQEAENLLKYHGVVFIRTQS